MMILIRSGPSTELYPFYYGKYYKFEGKQGHSWTVTIKGKGGQATLKYSDRWCPLRTDYFMDDVDEIWVDGKPVQILWPALAQAVKTEEGWKLVPGECGKGLTSPPGPRYKCSWKEPVGEVETPYGRVSIEDEEEGFKLSFKADDFDCSEEAVLSGAVPWPSKPGKACECDWKSAAWVPHPDPVSFKVFCFFTNLTTASCFSYAVVGLNKVISYTESLKVEGAPRVPAQCWPDLAGLGMALGIGFILSRLGGE